MAAGIVVVVDVVRRPDDNSPQGAAIVKKADEIDAACIVMCPNTEDFKEVQHPPLSVQVVVLPVRLVCLHDTLY